MNAESRTRFWRHVDRSGDCWLWTGCHNRDGYGRFGLNGRVVNAQRAAWMLMFGSIADGLQVCHRCDVPACVNPAHLFLGTQAENNADRNAKGRQMKGERQNFAKLTPDLVREIRASYAAGGVTTRALAARYGMAPSAIHGVISRRHWAHVV